MTTDQLTGIAVATAVFDSLDGRDMFLLALAARNLIITQMTDLPGHPYRGYSVAYLTEPLPAETPACTTCGGELELSDQYPDAGYLHRNDSDDTHTPRAVHSRECIDSNVCVCPLAGND